jgi:ABC-type bacteriocin/lantibiotic exporter with double-glycine peptidase domain
MLYESVVDYFKASGIYIKDTKQMMLDTSVLKNINSYLPSGIYSFHCVDFVCSIGDTLPPFFILEDNSGDYQLIEKTKAGFRFVSGSDGRTGFISNPIGLRVIYFNKQVAENNVKDTYNLLMRMSPKVAYLSSFLLFFTLLSPLYSNIFNTRLIYSDTFNSVLYISMVFIIFLGMEVSARIFLSHKSSIKTRHNNIILNDFYISLLKNSKCHDVIVKIKLLDSSINAIWKVGPLLLMDLVIIITLTTCILFLLGKYGIILTMYYVLFSILCIKIRFDNYNDNYAGMEYAVEKMSVLNILELNKLESRLILPVSLSGYMKKKILHEENNKFKVNTNNHYWDELIKANSFVSMVVMFSICYFAVSEGLIGIGSIIAIMVINSRLSASVTSLITKVFSFLIYRDHVLKSLSVIYKEKCKTDGFYINDITGIVLENYVSNIAATTLDKEISMAFFPGDVVGVLGPSGSGKTTFLKSLSGANFDYSGDIIISSVSTRKLSQAFFAEAMVYYSAQSCFFKGSLRENFNLHGVVDNNSIARIIKESGVNIDSTLFDDVDANELPLSNGEKQKLKLCMIFESKKKVILLDEPTCFLSVDDGIKIMSDLLSSNRDAIVFIATHDPSLFDFMNKKICPSSLPTSLNPSKINIGLI